MSSKPSSSQKQQNKEQPSSSSVVILKENSKSVAGLPLPKVPPEYENTGKHGTILLFYQYKEPPWTEKEHKYAIKKAIALGQLYDITGRGRVAPEGFNCTLTSRNPWNMRKFCQALRDWDPIFWKTDFKFTDGVPHDQLFKSLSIRKATELVAYGLDGEEKAPSLHKFAGEHLEADEFHKAMQDKDAVIIDVRNAYESAIGNFQPPSNGARLIDPKMRNSIEWPKWLADPDTQRQLNNKNVLMYCTGGIRCERASALLNQMTTATANSKNNKLLRPRGVYELRGGIERYIKTFPTGGFWKGKNYLFDRRMEQVPADKPPEQVEEETNSLCCLCRNKCTVYRGKFKCCKSLCGVPVIVCEHCRAHDALQHPEELTCELCKEGYYNAPKPLPDLVGLKRKAESSTTMETNQKKRSKREEKEHPTPICKNRLLFISKLPLVITKGKLAAEWLGEIVFVQWLVDKNSKAFYGSCIVELPTVEAANKVLTSDIPKLGGKKRKPKVSLAKLRKDGEKWPPPGYIETEFPPIGT